MTAQTAGQASADGAEVHVNELLAGVLDELAALRRAVEALTPAVAGEWLTVAELAAAMGVSRGYVYEHQVELGAVRLPSGGSRPRLRFPAIARYGSERSQPQEAQPALGEQATTKPQPGRPRRSMANSRPEPGSVLAVRPRGGR